MLYKRKKSMIHIIFSFIFYVFLFIFIILGLLNLFNFTYEEMYAEKQNTPSEHIDLELKPIEQENIISNNIIEEVKEKEEDIPEPQDPNTIKAMEVISNYYIAAIDKNIKKHFSAKPDNMCKLVYKVSKLELIIVSCDDFTFKRQVELALVNVKPYKNKIVNGVDLSKELVYFDYLINR